jgi:hypothetical protein
VETPEGRAEYVRRQRGFAESGAVLRERLIASLDGLLALVAGQRAPAGPPHPPLIMQFW